MLIPPSPYERHFYFIFRQDVELNWFYRPFVRHPFYRHVSLLTPSVEGSVYIEPSWKCIQVYTSDLPVEEVIAADFSTKHIVIRYVIDSRQQSIKHISNMVPSCVSVAKMMAGLRTWAVTPYQLKSFLLRNGGVVV